MRVHFLTYRRTERFSHFTDQEIGAEPVVTIYAEARVFLDPGEVPRGRREEVTWVLLEYDFDEERECWSFRWGHGNTKRVGRDGVRVGREGSIRFSSPSEISPHLSHVVSDVAEILEHPWKVES